MANTIEIRERQKLHLYALLKIKKDNAGIKVNSLQELIIQAVVAMEEEDIAMVEKIMGVKVFE